MSTPPKTLWPLLLIACLTVGSTVCQQPSLQETSKGAFAFPLARDSVRFAIIGDSGTGDSNQYEVAAQMSRQRAALPFTFVLMLGDNIYGGHSKSDLKRKFADPYQQLMSDQVKFYASLGNHDDQNERF